MQIKTPQDIAKLVRQARKDAGLTQAKLAKLCGVGTRFIVDLEAGKPTCQLDKTLIVLHGLGVKFEGEPPLTAKGFLSIIENCKQNSKDLTPKEEEEIDDLYKKIENLNNAQKLLLFNNYSEEKSYD